MKILFATTTLPTGRITGGEVASAAFVETMRECGHSVEVIGYRRSGSSWQPGPWTINVGDRPIESAESGWRTPLWLAMALATRQAYSVVKFRSRAYRKVLSERLADLQPEVVVVDHSQMGWIVPEAGPGPRLVFLAHNIEHELYADAATRAGGATAVVNRRESRLVRVMERRLAERTDAAWALSHTDQEKLRELGAGRTRAFGLPPAVKPAAASERPAATHDIGLLGTWSWELNAAGLRWFLAEVCPALGEATSIAVAGAGSERFAEAAPPGVRCLGRVEDAGQFLAASRVVAIPAVTSAGVQIKTLDAIASGSAVVATNLALRGLDDVPPTVVVRDGAEGFARAALELLAAPRTKEQRVSAAQAWASRRRDRFREELSAELDALGPGAGSP